jgi:CDP-2,3-bis-(O-geranylgeranyl)-sn-glycerol synthase
VIGAAVDPRDCALFLIVSFALAGFTQAAWLGSDASRRFAWPVDGGLTFRGRRLFGDNKTVRGFVVMPAATGVAFLVVFVLAKHAGASLWPLTAPQYGVLGLVAGTGFMLGELPNSFLKRQLGIAPGAPARGRVLRPLWFAIDRLDSAAGALAALALLVSIPPVTVIYALAAGSVVHGVFSVLTFRLGGKARAA